MPSADVTLFAHLFVLCLLPLAAWADVSGTARAIDGDTLLIEGEHIRLFGIDAPEQDQTCEAADGSLWACGRWSGEVLGALVAGRTVRCAGRERDHYDRLVATCTAGGVDLGESLVSRGAVVAYTRYGSDYVDAEKAAAIAGVGIWAGQFEDPAEVRAGSRAVVAPTGTHNDCAIKGNIFNSGQIYHLPGQRDYERTRIDVSQGERWFCSPREAEAAGWRPARR